MTKTLTGTVLAGVVLALLGIGEPAEGSLLEKARTWALSVSNGDVLSAAQLVMIFYLYNEVKRVQVALIQRGAAAVQSEDDRRNRT